jgi:hypothetical protein
MSNTHRKRVMAAAPAEPNSAQEPEPRKPWQSPHPLAERKFASTGMRLSAERLLDSVTDEFEQFIERASYLDLYLLYEVLNQHACNTLYLNQNEASLADAFMASIGIDLAGLSAKGGA